MIRFKAFSSKYTGLLVLLLLAGFALTLHARSKDYLMELTIITDKQEEFVYLAEIDDRQLRDLRNNTNFEIKPYLVEARRKCADEIGYRKEIYGEENYKMVVISRYKLIIRDKSSGRVLLSK
jgi:hypothetical protein